MHSPVNSNSRSNEAQGRRAHEAEADSTQHRDSLRDELASVRAMIENLHELRRAVDDSGKVCLHTLARCA